MPIVVGLVVVALVIYGAVWSFDTIHAHFGLGVAVGAAVVAIAIVAAAIMRWLASRREIAPNVPKGSNGDWTHELKREWGGVRVASQKRLCDVRLRDETGSYIFADLRGARAEEAGGAWRVLLDVKDAKHAEWVLPMEDRGEAHKWARILGLAAAERL